MSKHKASPFSTTRNWVVEWAPIQPPPSKSSFFREITQAEENAIRAIAEIGVIGGVQLTRLFLGGKKEKLKKMVAGSTIIEHFIYNEERRIPIYTLGELGARLVEKPFRQGQWMEYTTSQILERLAFFQFYGRFSEIEAVKVVKGNEPFVGNIKRIGGDQKSFHVGVVRDNLEKWSRMFKWDHKQYEKESIFLISETIAEIIDFENVGNFNVRLVLDEDLKNPFESMFHKWDKASSSWIRVQVPNKVAKAQ